MQAWLVTIAHRKAIDITRARARTAMPVGELPEQTLDGRRARPGRHELWADVAALPDKQRRRSPITTWPACPTRRSPRSSAAPPMPPAGPPRTGSRHCAAATLEHRPIGGRDSNDRAHDAPRLRWRPTCRSRSRHCTSRIRGPVQAARFPGRSGRRGGHPGHRLPHPGYAGRDVAAGRHRRGPDPGGVRPRGPRRRAGVAGREGQPADHAGARPAGPGGPRAGRSTSPAAGGPSTCRWTSGCPADSGAACWPTCRRSATGTPRAMRRSRPPPAARGRSGRSARRAPPIRCRWSCRATGWCVRTASFGGYRGGPEAKRLLLTLESRRLSAAVSPTGP